MGPSKPLGDWVKGIVNALDAENCERREMHSLVAKVNASKLDTSVGGYVFFVDQDHVDQERNRFDYELGVFEKSVPALSVELGSSMQAIRQAQELYQAVYDALDDNELCRVLITRGTKRGTEKNKGLWCVFDPDYWVVVGLSGSVEEGFGFRLERECRLKVGDE
ncbi:hypothetical protein ACP6H1_27440 [Vibrio harveyi]|uniref:hypothetical protein n=1 Tax=Vibrio harveyi TaxID=669 RepID=UPI003CF27838